MKMTKQNPKTKTTEMKKYKFNEMLIQITNNTKKVKPVKMSKAKVEEAWGKVSMSRRYRKAVAKEFCKDITTSLIDECVDGVCLNLSECNNMKSEAVQKRVLRRIVEKRQAQATHRRVGRTENLFATHIEKRCCSKSMTEINLYRFSA